MTPQENTIYLELEKNSIVFFKDFIERITSLDNGEEDEMKRELVMLSISSLQISMELAMKSVILKRSGIYEILDSRDGSHHNQTMNQIILDFQNNLLKTKTFEKIKSFVKRNNLVDTLDDDDFETINQFQKYRNGMVHLSYNFNEGDYFDLKFDIIYFAVNILIKVLCSNDDGGLRPSEYLQYRIGTTHHQKLISYRPYILAMERLAKQNSDLVYDCFFCYNHTMSEDEEYCYSCNIYYDQYGFTQCDFCNHKNSMIYDNLNLEYNQYSTKGYCLNCKSDTILFSCPTCENVYNLETEDHASICNINHCNFSNN